jgi:mono/diheme cytochrome c family protein
MSRYWIHFTIAILIAIAAVLFVRLHNASGTTPDSDGVSAGHRLAEAWCTTCHATDSNAGGTSNTAPDFVAIANQPATTALSLKVFLQTSHRSMPNLVLTPEQADDLASYILSMKRN